MDSNPPRGTAEVGNGAIVGKPLTLPKINGVEVGAATIGVFVSRGVGVIVRVGVRVGVSVSVEVAVMVGVLVSTVVGAGRTVSSAAQDCRNRVAMMRGSIFRMGLVSLVYIRLYPCKKSDRLVHRSLLVVR